MAVNKHESKWKDFDSYLKQVENETSFIPDETEADKQKRIKRALKDYRFFFEYYFPKFAKSKTAWFHVLTANMLLKSKVFKAVLNWFRGSAKSTHATMGIPLWLMVNGQLKAMLLVGQTEKKAKRLLGSLQGQLMRNKRFINDFGEQFSFGNWEDGEFVTKDGIAFYSIGIGQDPSGMRFDENRIDYAVIDDCDDSKLGKNPIRVKERWDWINDDLAGCFDIGYERLLIVNNLKSKVSLVASAINEKLAGAKAYTTKLFKALCADNDIKYPTHVKSNAYEFQKKGNWIHFKVTACDEEFNPTWDDKYTQDYWKDKRSDSSLRSWEISYKCNPITEGKTFKANWIHWKLPLPLHEYDRLVLYGDPAWKNTNTSDFKAAKLWGKKGRELWLLKAFVRNCTLKSFVQFFYDVHDTKPENVTIEYYMEANFMQDLILDDFDVEGDDRGYQLPINGDYRKKPDKDDRIESMSPLYERSFIIYNEAERHSPDMEIALEHLLAFEKGCSTPKDSMDADEGAINKLQQGGRTDSNPVRHRKRSHKNAY